MTRPNKLYTSCIRNIRSTMEDFCYKSFLRFKKLPTSSRPQFLIKTTSSDAILRRGKMTCSKSRNSFNARTFPFKIDLKMYLIPRYVYTMLSKFTLWTWSLCNEKKQMRFVVRGLVFESGFCLLLYCCTTDLLSAQVTGCPLRSESSSSAPPRGKSLTFSYVMKCQA